MVIIEELDDHESSSSAQSVGPSGVDHRKNTKKVQFVDQRESFSDDTWSIPEGNQWLPRITDAQQSDWDQDDYDDGEENYQPFSAHVRDPRSRSTAHLHRSISSEHIPLRFELEIMPDELQSFNIPTLQRQETLPNKRDEQLFSRELEKRHIVTSLSNLDDQGQETIEMWHTLDLPDEPFTHWRHIKRQFMDLEEFTQLALQTPHVRESSVLSYLVDHFMEKVKKKFSISRRQGERTLNGVLRCDARAIQDGDSVDVTATWLCFPYLSKGDDYKDGISTKESRGLYRTRTLFQWSYEREPASEREERQAFLKEAKQLLYVPQVWVLLLGKDTIITSSPCYLEQLVPEIIKLQLVPPQSHRLRWIKLIGPHHRETIVPATDCSTFCALSISVTDMCFDGNEWEHMFDLFIDDYCLTADLWLYFTETVKSSTLEVRIRVKQHRSPRDITSISTQSSGGNKDSYSEVDCSESESLTESAWIRSPAYDIISEGPPNAENNSEFTQSARTNDGNEREKDIVVHAPKPSLETEEVTQRALSQVRPFLEWDLQRNYSVIDLSSQAMKEEVTTLYLLTNIHGRLGNPSQRFPSIKGVSPELSNEYLENSFYSELPIEALAEIEGLEENEKEGYAESTIPQSHESSPTTGSQLSLPRSVIKRQLKKGLQRDRRGGMILEMMRSTKQIVAHFVPCSEDHILLGKVWGALKVLEKITANPNPEHRHTIKQVKKWTVLGSRMSIAKMMSIYEIPNPDRHSWDICEACERGTAYESTEEAIHHLVLEHYYKTEVTKETTNALSLLVQSAEEVWMKGVRKAHCAMFEVVLRRLDNLQRVMLKVKKGLSQSSRDSPPAYTLPKTLIQVLEHFVGFILVCNHTARLIDSAYATWVPTKSEETEILKVNGYIDFVDKFGRSTQDLLFQACDDVYSMVRATIPSSRKICKSVGMQYTTANVLRNLLVRPLVGEHSTVEFYVDIFSGLQYRVFHERPRRRLFSSINLLQEDIRALVKVRRAQQSVLQDLCAALEPDTFHGNIGPTEIYQCESSMCILDSAIEATLWDINELRWILRQSLDLERRAKHRIEILEEDHGKAIFVFTLVTAVFLPLSFVTSYMGMNTADIRDMQATQERFWMVAVPVTLTVMVTAAFLAYKGHLVKAWLLSMPRWLDKGETGIVEENQGRKNVEPVPVEKSAAIGLLRSATRWRRGGKENLDQGNPLPV